MTVAAIALKLCQDHPELYTLSPHQVFHNVKTYIPACGYVVVDAITRCIITNRARLHDPQTGLGWGA